MADKKISQLNAASTPLAGTEVLPIVQSGTTKKVTALELTGTTVDSFGNVTIPAGNLVQGTAAKGINFTANTPAAGMTSQLLNWYETGTWTPTDNSGAGLAFTNVHGFYTRVGDIVTAFGRVTFPTTASLLAVVIGGLPFVVANNEQPGGGFIRLTNSGRNDTVVASATTSQILFYDTNINAAVNSNYSGDRVDWVVIYKV